MKPPCWKKRALLTLTSLLPTVGARGGCPDTAAPRHGMCVPQPPSSEPHNMSGVHVATRGCTLFFPLPRIAPHMGYKTTIYSSTVQLVGIWVVSHIAIFQIKHHKYLGTCLWQTRADQGAGRPGWGWWVGATLKAGPKVFQGGRAMPAPAWWVGPGHLLLYQPLGISISNCSCAGGHWGPAEARHAL